jgi:hypothetical protein
MKRHYATKETNTVGPPAPTASGDDLSQRPTAVRLVKWNIKYNRVRVCVCSIVDRLLNKLRTRAASRLVAITRSI